MPDLDLIKQVEEVTISALKDRPDASRRFPSEAITDALKAPRSSDWAINAFGCYLATKTARSGRGRPVLRRGSPAMLPAAPGGSTNRATWATEPLLCEIR
jgi:hypothetical protein